MHAQFPLELSLRSEQHFDNFIDERNELVLFLLRRMAAGEGEKQLFIWGDSGAGKSHMLNAVANEAFRQRHRVFVLSFSVITQANFGVEILEGLASQDMLCIDDVDGLLDLPAWAEAIAGLIEQASAQRCRLVLSAKKRPTELEGLAPKLIERLQWGPVIELLTPSDETLERILTQRAKDMGLLIERDVCQYLLKRLPRDTTTLLNCLQALGQESLASQRRLNLRFVSQLLSTQARLSAFLARQA